MANNKEPGDKRSKWHLKRRQIAESLTVKALAAALAKNEDLLSKVLSVQLNELPKLIKNFAGIDGVPFQEEVIKACLTRILKETKGHILPPHIEQVRAVRRLVYSKGDTLFIARTGFGKSLILHSYTLLTGKITLQIVP